MHIYFLLVVGALHMQKIYNHIYFMLAVGV